MIDKALKCGIEGSTPQSIRPTQFDTPNVGNKYKAVCSLILICFALSTVYINGIYIPSNDNAPLIDNSKNDGDFNRLNPNIVTIVRWIASGQHTQ